MNEEIAKLFGAPLEIDPTVALPRLKNPIPLKVGPLHKVQFVIEFVGPRSALASQVSQLFEPQWYQALGQPTMYSMRPADLGWHPLTSATDGSYDSLALTWDYLSSNGRLSSASAAHLLMIADRMGPLIQRRPLAIPQPTEVDELVESLLHTQELLDVGFAVTVVGHRDFDERDIWVQCARLGLEFSPGGSFDYRMMAHPYPLFSVTPFGEYDAFSLGAAQRGAKHAGITLGFNMPRCPAPKTALEGCFHAAQTIAKTLGGAIFTDDQRPMSQGEHQHLLASMDQALLLFSQIGLIPGSGECLKLFPLTD